MAVDEATVAGKNDVVKNAGWPIGVGTLIRRRRTRHFIGEMLTRWGEWVVTRMVVGSASDAASVGFPRWGLRRRKLRNICRCKCG